MTCRAPLLLVAACGALSICAAEVRAEPLFESRITGHTCYSRSYEEAHLRRHPRQTVTRFHVRHANPDPLRANNPDRFTVAFGFRTKGTTERFAGFAECTSNSRGAACLVEGDGGGFALAAAANGLQVTIERLELEGPKTFAVDLAKGDNRVMLLHRGAAAACADR